MVTLYTTPGQDVEAFSPAAYPLRILSPSLPLSLRLRLRAPNDLTISHSPCPSRRRAWESRPSGCQLFWARERRRAAAPGLTLARRDPVWHGATPPHTFSSGPRIMIYARARIGQVGVEGTHRAPTGHPQDTHKTSAPASTRAPSTLISFLPAWRAWCITQVRSTAAGRAAYVVSCQVRPGPAGPRGRLSLDGKDVCLHT